VPFRDRLGGRAILQIGRLDREEDLPHRGFEAIVRRGVLERVETELVQQRRHRDVRIVCQGIPQSERAIGGQLADEAIG
jgi:hypothetical protein